MEKRWQWNLAFMSAEYTSAMPYLGFFSLRHNSPTRQVLDSLLYLCPERCSH